MKAIHKFLFIAPTLNREGRTALVVSIHNVLIENKASTTGCAWTIFHSSPPQITLKQRSGEVQLI